MDKLEKLYDHILMRRSDANVAFETLRTLLRRLGFDERIKGDHHIFIKDGKGKPYQVKQVRDVILKCHLRIGD